MYQEFAEALPFFYSVKPYLNKCAAHSFESVSETRGLELLNSYIHKCQAPETATFGLKVLMHSHYDHIVQQGGLSHAEIDHFKNVANRMFADRHFLLALLIYDGLRHSLPSIETSGVRFDMEATLCSNAAQCLLKVGDFVGAEERASQALTIAPNAKALYRRAIAREQLGNLDGSRGDACMALKLAPTAEVKELVARLQTLP